ncbi:hypothetical protein BU17DRAFT_99068 [Hysterangium stoloniferum]|nr:hypothetical protein BU17DRAFT_99068 [Hysterangium stoloniferum]
MYDEAFIVDEEDGSLTLVGFLDDFEEEPLPALAHDLDSDDENDENPRDYYPEIQELSVYIHQDAWFRDIAGAVLRVLLDDVDKHIASLTLHIELGTSLSLYQRIHSLQTFFDDSTLLTDHINQLNVVSSLIGPIVRLILTHTSPNWDLIVCGERIITLTLELIAGSSEHESAYTTVRRIDTIPMLVLFFHIVT